MILTPAETRAVLARRKTMARVPVASRNGVMRRCPFVVGSSYAVQPGAGEPAAAQVAVHAVRRERAGAITSADAKAEGNRTVGWWKQAWVRRHDAAWMKRERVELADIFGDEVVPFILLKRFEERWAGVEVWVVSFALTEDKPEFLAHPGPHQGDYTTSPGRSFDPDCPIVDRLTVERYAKAALVESEKRRASLRADLEAARAEAKAARGRSFRDGTRFRDAA